MRQHEYRHRNGNGTMIGFFLILAGVFVLFFVLLMNGNFDFSRSAQKGDYVQKYYPEAYTPPPPPRKRTSLSKHYKRGARALRKRRYRAAISHFDKLIVRGHKHRLQRKAYVRKGEALCALGSFSRLANLDSVYRRLYGTTRTSRHIEECLYRMAGRREAPRPRRREYQTVRETIAVDRMAENEELDRLTEARKRRKFEKEDVKNPLLPEGDMITP